MPEEDAYETLGGLILHRLAAIPKKGDQLKINDINVKIKEVKGARIILVHLMLL